MSAIADPTIEELENIDIAELEKEANDTFGRYNDHEVVMLSLMLEGEYLLVKEEMKKRGIDPPQH
jgi:hypothetical protein